MRAIWTGSISFGLVNVPVKLYGATESHDVSFHQVHDDDGGRIRYQRTCDKCGEPVDYGDIDKAYDDGERTVVMDDDDFEALPAAAKDEIEVVQFVPADQIDPIMLEKAYFLEPVGKSPKSYLLLRQTLEDAELTAVVRFSLREKTRLGVLRTRGKVMVLQGLLWGDEVRAVDFPAVSTTAKVSAAELKMSAALVEQFAGDFEPDEFHDDYQEQLRKLIDAKLEEGDSVDTAATLDDEAGDGKDDGGEVIDLMEALKRSLARGRGDKGGDDAKRDGGKAESGDEAQAKPASKTASKRKPAASKSKPASKSAKTSPSAKDDKADGDAGKRTPSGKPARRRPAAS